MLCKVQNCGNDATDFLMVTVPNTPTENYDAVNPVRVDVCAYHRRLVHGQIDPSAFSIASSLPKETHD